jgi:hypothetical protein
VTRDELKVWLAGGGLGMVVGSPIAIALVIGGYWYSVVAGWGVPVLFLVGWHFHTARRRRS